MSGPFAVKVFDRDLTCASNSSFTRMLYTVTAVLSLVSELISVMWSTVAVNKLTEMKITPAASVW